MLQYFTILFLFKFKKLRKTTKNLIQTASTQGCHYRAFKSSPRPMMPSVSPRMRAAPPATSLICSTLEARVPSRKAWCIQVTRRYRFKIKHMEVSAVSSTDAAGTLHTAIPEQSKQMESNCSISQILRRTNHPEPKQPKSGPTQGSTASVRAVRPTHRALPRLSRPRCRTRCRSSQ